MKISIRYTGRIYNLIRSTEPVCESIYGIGKVGRILKYGNTIRNTAWTSISGGTAVEGEPAAVSIQIGSTFWVGG
jgi:hypothetical protein